MNSDKPIGPNGAIYVRVSSDKQDRESQQIAIDAYLQREGLTVHRDNIFSEVGSRTDADVRPAFQRLQQAVTEGRVKWILVLALDRYGTADVFEQTFYLRHLYRHGCGLFSVTEPSYGNIAHPDMVTNLMASVASARSTDELDARGKRNHQGKAPAAKRGYSPGGLPAYGYDYACIDQQGNEKWRIFYAGYSVEKDASGKEIRDVKGRPVYSLKRIRIWPDGHREEFVGRNQKIGRDSGDKLILVPSVDVDRCEIVKFIFNTFTSQDITCGEIALQLRAMGKQPPTQEGAFYLQRSGRGLEGSVFCV